jgi:hypothetical protein
MMDDKENNKPESFNKDDSVIAPQEEKKLDDSFKKEVDDVKQVIYQTVMDFHNYIFPKYIMNYKSYL